MIFSNLLRKSDAHKKVEPQPEPSSRDVKPLAPDAGPWVVKNWVRPGSIAIQSKDSKHEVALVVVGVFDSATEQEAYAYALAEWLNKQAATSVVETPAHPAAAAPDNAQAKTDEAPGGHTQEPHLDELIEVPGARKEPSLLAGPEQDCIKQEVRGEPAYEQPSVSKLSLGERVTRLIHSSSFPLGKKPADVVARESMHVAIQDHVPLVAAKAVEPVSPEVAQHQASTRAPVPFAPVPAPTSQAPAPEPDYTDQPCMIDLDLEPGVPVQCACHFDLQPDQAPDDCVIDLGHPECCTIAKSGVLKEMCPHWLPIKIIPRVQA